MYDSLDERDEARKCKFELTPWAQQKVAHPMKNDKPESGLQAPNNKPTLDTLRGSMFAAPIPDSVLELYEVEKPPVLSLDHADKALTFAVRWTITLCLVAVIVSGTLWLCFQVIRHL